MKFETIAKPQFLAKFKRLTLSHAPDKLQPFSGKNKVRWAIVQKDTGKFFCVYEGKPSTQVMEGIRKYRKEILYLQEFDRAGVFFIQIVKFGHCSLYDYVTINAIYQQYHANISPEAYLDSFRRPVRKEKL